LVNLRGKEEKKMVTIEYTAEGALVSDFRIENWLAEITVALRTGYDYEFSVSTENPIHAIRLAIARDEISAEAIRFQYNGHTFSANKYGAILEWPEGFADRSCRLSENILRAATERKREERAGAGICK
jgi:hypothetical protein